MRIQYLDRPIAYHRALVPIAGATGAIFLSQAIYWSNRSKHKDKWFYKTRADWQEETGLTRYELEGVRKKLVKAGVLKEERRGVPAKMWYQVQEDVLFQLLDTIYMKESQSGENQPTDRGRTSRLTGGEPADCQVENQPTITENTREYDLDYKRTPTSKKEPKIKQEEDYGEIIRLFQEGHKKAHDQDLIWSREDQRDLVQALDTLSVEQMEERINLLVRRIKIAYDKGDDYWMGKRVTPRVIIKEPLTKKRLAALEMTAYDGQAVEGGDYCIDGYFDD